MDLSPLTAIPLFTALIVLIVGSPVIFKLTDKYLASPLKLTFASKDGLPTRLGLFVHAGVAALLMYAYLRSYSAEITSF